LAKRKSAEGKKTEEVKGLASRVFSTMDLLLDFAEWFEEKSYRHT